MDADKISKQILNILKWAVGTLVGLGLAVVIFWLIFYSTDTANFGFVISARNWYQDSIWKVDGLFSKPTRSYPPFMPIYTFMIRSFKNTKYTYLFWGTYKNIDLLNRTITLQGLDSKTYVFGYEQDIVENNGTILNASESTPQQIGLVEVIWDDTRNLSQILDAYKKDSSIIINPGLTNTFIISDLSRPILKNP